MGDILKNVQKNKCVFFSGVIWLMTMKVRLKMYNDGFSMMVTQYDGYTAKQHFKLNVWKG